MKKMNMHTMYTMPTAFVKQGLQEELLWRKSVPEGRSVSEGLEDCPCAGISERK
jgi:hypothetical protein